MPINMPKSKVMIQLVKDSGMFRVLNGPHMDEEGDKDEFQWNCPKCGAKWNDAVDDCVKCGEESPYEIVPPTGGTLPEKFKPDPKKTVKQIMHQMRKTPGTHKEAAMNKISSMLDAVAERLEAQGFMKQALEIDRIADMINAETHVDYWTKEDPFYKPERDPHRYVETPIVPEKFDPLKVTKSHLLEEIKKIENHIDDLKRKLLDLKSDKPLSPKSILPKIKDMIKRNEEALTHYKEILKSKE